MASRKKKTKVVPQNYMDKIPCRAADHPWREKEDGIVEIDMPHNDFYSRIAQKYFKKPKVSHISLDKYGTVVWKNIDGTHTIYDILSIMEETFPDEKELMLNRVVTYMATLESNQFITIK